MTDAADLLQSALRRLRHGDPDGARQVRLGVIVPARRRLGIPRPPRIEPGERAWHLGALLLGERGVWATNEVVLARAETVRGGTSENQRRRGDLAVAAHRGGFAEREVVHVGWEAVDVSAVRRGEASGPLLLYSGEPAIRWSAVGDPMPLARYLEERIELALNPPERS